MRLQLNSVHEVLSHLNTFGPEPYKWGLNHLSKQLIKQAEVEVEANSEVAFPLGRVVVGLLLLGHVQLGDVLMARLVKKCFFVVAWSPPRQPVSWLHPGTLLPRHDTQP